MAKVLRAKFVIQDGYSRVMERFERVTKKFHEQAEKASRKTDQLEQKIKGFGQRVTNIWNKLTGLWNGSSYSGIFKMVKAFMALKAVQFMINGIVESMKKMDDYMNTLSRLKLINDGTHTNEQFNDKIFAAANRSKGSYQGMAEAVAKMGMLAKNRFSSNDELIGFTELVQKSFRLGGADTTAQQSAMLQLSQAMASGRLQGDEYVSILENAPLIAKAIADYTGAGEEGLKKLSSDGLITAEVIKNAVFSMSKDINGEFEKLPNLWSDYTTRIKNETVRAFSGVTDTVMKAMNSKQFQRFINAIIRGIYYIATVVNVIVKFVIKVISAIAGSIFWLTDIIIANWDWISYIFYVVVIVAMIMFIGWVWSSIPAITAMVVKLWAMVPPILASAAAFLLTHWPILVLILLIAAVIWGAKKMGFTFSDVVGAVTSAYAVFFTYIANRVIFIRNLWANLGNFFANVFKDHIQSVKILFYDMANTVLGYIRNLAQGIEDLLNQIPGVEVTITGYIDDVMSKLEKVSNQAKKEMGWEELMEQKDYFDYKDVAQEWFQKGKKFTDDSIEKGKKFIDSFNNPYEGEDLSKLMDKIPDYTKGLGKKNTGVQKVKGAGRNGAMKVEMDKEDIRYLRDMAERDFVANIRHKTLAPNINVNFTGPISKETDTDKLYKRMTKILKEQIAMAGDT